jgi:hypothetical protein
VLSTPIVKREVMHLTSYTPKNRTAEFPFQATHTGILHLVFMKTLHLHFIWYLRHLQKSIIPLTLALSRQGRGITHPYTPLKRGLNLPSLDGRGWGGCSFETFARASFVKHFTHSSPLCKPPKQVGSKEATQKCIY